MLTPPALRKTHPIYQHPDCIPCLDLCTWAIERLKASGFELRTVSGRSEATYFGIAGRHGLLRVATHRNGESPIGLGPVIAWLTFRGGRDHRDVLLMTKDRFEAMLEIAIGRYWLRSSEPIESRYRGKRGTWEHAG